jgi:SsrA-binding protein
MGNIATNTKASRDYIILETFEAGIVLKGTEAKSLRQGTAQINDSFARIENGEAFLYNAHIPVYSHGNRENHKPDAVRKLLLHKREIKRLEGLLSQKGLTLIPLAFYRKGPWVKVKLGLAKRRTKSDKRQLLKEREADRRIQQTLMHKLKRASS